MIWSLIFQFSSVSQRSHRFFFYFKKKFSQETYPVPSIPQNRLRSLFRKLIALWFPKLCIKSMDQLFFSLLFGKLIYMKFFRDAKFKLYFFFSYVSYLYHWKQYHDYVSTILDRQGLIGSIILGKKIHLKELQVKSSPFSSMRSFTIILPFLQV